MSKFYFISSVGKELKNLQKNYSKNFKTELSESYSSGMIQTEKNVAPT